MSEGQPAHVQGQHPPQRLHYRAGSLAMGQWSVYLRPEDAGWSWSSLRTLVLPAGGTQVIETAEEEMLVVPLEGSCLVRCGSAEHLLTGRLNVFTGPTDFAYLPPRSAVVVASERGGRFALPGAIAQEGSPFAYRPSEAVPVELRGAGNCSRRVVNYCMPGSFEADRLIACEVFTPAGNWSSYPPHKHDEAGPGEAQLEEIYYFEVTQGPSGQEGFGYQRLYGTDERPIELLAEVRSGDVVLVPHGFHGPSMAAPGYDLYYFNVMAGPGPRAWLVTDDPAHAWVRAMWPGQVVSPQLLGGSGHAGSNGGAV